MGHDARLRLSLRGLEPHRSSTIPARYGAAYSHPGRPAIDPQDCGFTGQWMTGYSWLSGIVEKGFLPACHDVNIPDIVDVNTGQGSLGVTRFSARRWRRLS